MIFSKWTMPAFDATAGGLPGVPPADPQAPGPSSQASQGNMPAPTTVETEGEAVVRDPFAPVRGLIQRCVICWQLSWEPGNMIPIDETVVGWEGNTTGHISFLPRKPHALGFQMKTACDGPARFMLNIDLVEGAETDRRKRFMAETGNKQSTATTLRLVEPWRGSGKVIVGDSWFGSLRTAEELAEWGLYSCLCVKQGTSGYPKAEMREALRERGDTKFMYTKVRLGYEGEGDEILVYAGGHMDKAPLTLVGTVGMSLPGP